jgi:glucose/mannose-6-phosphate isomerase
MHCKIEIGGNMNLDDTLSFAQIDTQDMLSEIESLPNQLASAWQLSHDLPLLKPRNFRQIVIAGMGGSAIGADLLEAYATPELKIPLVVHRDYDLPGWAAGPETLVIAASHSGNTEETRSAFEAAQVRGCTTIAISTGGELAKAALATGTTLWQFDHHGQPRAAVGYSFGLLLGLFTRLGLIADPSAALEAALDALHAQHASLQADVPVVNNPAKRMAGQLYGRYVIVFGADILAPVARRWKGQINEIAKTGCQFEYLPEADHNTVAGIVNPAHILGQVMALFLRAPTYHPRNLLRTNLTKKIFMLEALNTDFIDAAGNGRLAHLLTTLHMGDYTAYYLAMAYGVDPTPVEAIESLKIEMQRGTPG